VELEQFKNVLAHPVFQTDPMAAITEHVKNSVVILQKQNPKPLPQNPNKKDKKSKSKSGGNKASAMNTG
jgi:hypothetical protein